ncbi:hypothetical protein DFH07DRAFT_830761 [Mycena maculata]|uniref:Uncharacterized protein n=1 Tax=Mycena maculata TaxID=230809 RepID=A0AAD7IPX2_9AGAR|nr:hypothetical protein DFH07DRAFT_830761 [Mycena maculata]
MPGNVHDEINLRRLVRRLEKSTSESQWEVSSEDTWIKAQGTLQKVKFARKLLADVELEDVDPTPKSIQRYDDLKTKLDRIDTFMRDLEKRNTPKRTRPEPILPHIPPPPDEPEPAPPLPQMQRAAVPDAIAVPEDPTSASLPTDNLLFSVSDVARSSFSSSVSPPLTTLLPPSFPPSATKSTTTALESHFTARQREMSEQMALMARQLKLNSLHFADLMEKDKQVVEETDQKLEGNYGYMQKTRERTKELRGKTGSTTCLSVLVVLVVILLTVLMVFLIRFSGI